VNRSLPHYVVQTTAASFRVQNRGERRHSCERRDFRVERGSSTTFRHVMKANTSPHSRSRRREIESFVTGTLADHHDRTTIGEVVAVRSSSPRFGPWDPRPGGRKRVYNRRSPAARSCAWSDVLLRGCAMTVIEDRRGAWNDPRRERLVGLLA